MIGDWLRLDHTYGLQMTREMAVRENLHGGPRHDQGEHQYQWSQGRMYNGLIVVMYALEDVRPGDGGLVCVPGSHKSNVNYHPDVYSPLVANPAFNAGDMLIFTEALVHGTRKWTSENRRRALLYKYSPGYSAWGNAENLKRYESLAADDLQRALLRPPYVGHRERLPFPEEGSPGDEH
jgi:ectoine hydroxylase-related dioxygenase (phytanoyl-CoA dioxygenase family)